MTLLVAEGSPKTLVSYSGLPEVMPKPFILCGVRKEQEIM